MPGYRGHLTGGLITYLILLYAVMLYCVPTALTAIEWLLCALAGSLFPDVDIKSKGQKFFYWALFGVFLFLVIQQRFVVLAMLSIVGVMPLLVHHRGLFHRAWFIVAVPLVIAFLFGLKFPFFKRAIFFDLFFFIAGALSHLWLDLGWRRMWRW